MSLFARSVNPFAPLANGYKIPAKPVKSNKTIPKTEIKPIKPVEDEKEEDVSFLKEKLEKLRRDVSEQYDKDFPRIREIKKLMMVQKNSCISTSACAEELKIHLDVCVSEPKCRDNYVAYECRYAHQNGRCSHYYGIKRLEEELEMYEYYIDENRDRIIDLEIDYEVALAKKEGRYEEYKESLYDEFS
jgi:hypothetical protein